MRLSTSTNIMDRYQKVQSAVSMEDCIRRCHAAGYRVLDMNCHDMSNPGMPLAQDNWEAWAHHVADLAAELGIEFSQSHAHFYHFLHPDLQNLAWHEELLRRSIDCSAILGVRWMTVHAATEAQTKGFSHARSKRGNLEYFPPFFERALKKGVGIVLENMFDPNPLQRTYTASPEDLLDLVDAFHDARIGVCWDFGHANLVGIDQNMSLLQVGSRLKSTHVSDNHGTSDEHLLPFYGLMDWQPLMNTLKQIGYAGDLTFEITPFLDRVPPAIRDTALRHTVEVGQYLMAMAECDGTPELGMREG